MHIEKVGKRNVVFTYHLAEWDLNLHLIMGRRYHYIVDTGLGSESVAPIKEYLGSDRKPIIVINTHYHWDHIWGNHVFSDGPIIAHSLCRATIIRKWDDMIRKNERYIRGDVRICLPSLVFEDSLYFPDDRISIFYTPGHTADCISVFDEEDGVLNAGDNIGDTLPEIVPSLKTEPTVYLSSIQKYKALDINACISGHNTILGKEVLDHIEEACNTISPLKKG